MENFKKIGENAIRAMRGVLEGTIPSEEASKDGIGLASNESVKEVINKNTNVTEAMRRNAEIAEVRNKAILKEDEN